MYIKSGENCTILSSTSLKKSTQAVSSTHWNIN